MSKKRKDPWATKEARRNTKFRKIACKCAAMALAGNRTDDVAFSPMAWALTTFFESYMHEGSKRTRKNFGPPKRRKAPVITLVPKR